MAKIKVKTYNLEENRPTDHHLFGGTILCGRNQKGDLSPIYGRGDLLLSLLNEDFNQKLTDSEHIEERFEILEAKGKDALQTFIEDYHRKALKGLFDSEKTKALYTEEELPEVRKQTFNDVEKAYRFFEKKLNIRIIEHPLTDSATFNAETDYPRMLDAICQSFEEGRDVKAWWGTTSAHFYVPMLTYGAIKRGYLFDPKGNETNKLHFYGSNVALQDAIHLFKHSVITSCDDAIPSTAFVNMQLSHPGFDIFAKEENKPVLGKNYNYITSVNSLQTVFMKQSVGVENPFAHYDIYAKQDYKKQLLEDTQPTDSLLSVPFPICRGTPPENVNALIEAFTQLDDAELPNAVITEVIPQTEKELKQFCSLARQLKDRGCSIVFVAAGISQAELRNIVTGKTQETSLMESLNRISEIDKSLEGMTNQHELRKDLAERIIALDKKNNRASLRKKPKKDKHPYLTTLAKEILQLPLPIRTVAKCLSKSDKSATDNKEFSQTLSVYLTNRLINAGVVCEDGSAPAIAAKAMQGAYGKRQVDPPKEPIFEIPATDKLTTAVFGFVPSQKSCDWFTNLQAPEVASSIVAAYETDYLPPYFTLPENGIALHGNHADLSLETYVMKQRYEDTTAKPAYAAGEGQKRPPGMHLMSAAGLAPVIHESLMRRANHPSSKWMQYSLDERLTIIEDNVQEHNPPVPTGFHSTLHSLYILLEDVEAQKMLDSFFSSTEYLYQNSIPQKQIAREVAGESDLLPVN